MTREPRIVVLGTVPDRSEAALVAAVIERGVPLAAVVRHDATRLDDLAAAGLPLLKVGLRRSTRSDDVRRLRTFLEQQQPQLIHVLRSQSLALLRAALPTARWPPVLFYRGTTEVPRWWNPAHRRKYLHPRMTCFHAVSEAVRQALVSGGVPASRVVVVRKGHDPAWYHATPIDLRAQLGLAAATFLVGVVANIRWVKGVEFAVDAIDRLVSRGVDVHLVLIGADERPWWQRRRAPLARPGSVTMLGRRDDVPALLPSLDAFLLPSLSEGSPRVVVEAVLCEVPVIAAAVGGVPEILVDGRSGLLVPPGDGAAIAAGLQRLIDDVELRRRLTVEAKRWILAHLTVDAAADAIVEVYRRLAKVE